MAESLQNIVAKVSKKIECTCYKREGNISEATGHKIACQVHLESIAERRYQLLREVQSGRNL